MKSFPVFLIQLEGRQIEVSLARSAQGQFNKETSIEADLLRRDLTINSMAMEIASKQVIDPFGGLQDLKAKVLRATSVHFKDDVLRTYRVARFAAQYGFSISAETKRLMQETKDSLFLLSRERVFEELKKALLTTQPSLFFYSLQEIGVLDVHFKELNDLIARVLNDIGDVSLFTQTMLALDRCRKTTDQEVVLFSTLVYHVANIPSLSKRLRLPNKWLKAARFAERYVSFVQSITDLPKTDLAPKIADFLERVERNPLGLLGLLLVCTAHYNGKKGVAKQQHPCFDFFITCQAIVKQIKGNPSLQGLAAKEEKRQREIAALNKWLETMDDFGYCQHGGVE